MCRRRRFSLSSLSPRRVLTLPPAKEPPTPSAVYVSLLLPVYLPPLTSLQHYIQTKWTAKIDCQNRRCTKSVQHPPNCTSCERCEQVRPMSLATPALAHPIRSITIPTIRKRSPHTCPSSLPSLLSSAPPDTSHSDDWCHLCQPWYGEQARRNRR
ncbi:hypothetical protein M422DRAFT_49451 [Sphaerobolus stellatus SS14]|uniref:Uncharacterized protein n=1 Tax=Sphaerobolus stellatus (strain SS14) TaxID=990650 RepID=A0A0C9VF07_SPHS4|nr:hypothetical protein M422DRAFT_49451 [Sphaerobolus stellatus SS14]